MVCSQPVRDGLGFELPWTIPKALCSVPHVPQAAARTMAWSYKARGLGWPHRPGA